MATDYEVTSQQPSNDVASNGSLIDVMRVSFQTIPEGIAGQVTVALVGYGPESVAAAIQPLVDQIKAVAAL